MIQPLTLEKLGTVTNFALRLWPDNIYEDLINEFKSLIHQDNQRVFLYHDKSSGCRFCACQFAC